MALSDRAENALVELANAIPGGERREPQEQMARAVGQAITSGRHLVAQAGTGTGKSFAYLVPAILSGQPVVIATATKALQDQLANKDLPLLSEHLSKPFEFAVLKGRSNYICRQRLNELSGDGQLALDGLATLASPNEIAELKKWASTTTSGDRAELPKEPSPSAWAAVSVSAQECPGASRCPAGEACFTETARARAAEADVIVVNLHLLGLDLASEGAILPPHDLVVVDEAHQLEDVISDTAGFELAATRLTHLARTVRSVIDDPSVVDELETSGALLNSVLGEYVGQRLRSPIPAEIGDALVLIRARLDRVMSALRAIPDTAPPSTQVRRDRAVALATAVMTDIVGASDVPESSVAWVQGPEHNSHLCVAPLDVRALLRSRLWEQTTTVLTSATIPPGFARSVGLEQDEHTNLDVGSPFDYESNSLLYCATHLPDPRSDGFDAAVHDELEHLIAAAGGRTLALFTSYRAMDAAVEALRPRLAGPVLCQRDLPKPALVETFTNDESASLFATMGFWQGIDVPGRTLSLVTIDRLPFPRPDEPLLAARRERAKAQAFALIDLPRTATMLAQGVGRLIRTTSDTGVVAIFDPRLAGAKSYRWTLINALPPMKRTKDRVEVERFLKQITSGV
ncbi:MAG: ATP-dependent DNA helicase [Acidimicrobiales bacterium]|nr:ATP-dependent DNA helicase [Acidimicrobiales bacterium]